MFWNKHENLKNLIFAIMAIFLLLTIMQMKNIALLAFAAFVLTCSFTPAVDKLSEFKHISRTLAATIVILASLLAVLLFLVPVGIIAGQEIQQLVSNMPDFMDKITVYLNSKTLMGKPLLDYINVESLINSSTEITSNILNKSFDFTVSFFGGIAILVTLGVIVFYALCEKNILRNAVIALFPPRLKPRARTVYENIEEKVGGYIVAQILLMSGVAILTAIGLMLIKVPYAVLIGLITGILDIIPIVGPIAAFLIGVLCASQLGWVAIVLTCLVYLLVQWAENYFLRPLVFGKFLKLHPIIIIFAFLISAQFLGVVGVILSPAIAALIITLFDEIYLKTINKNQEEK